MGWRKEVEGRRDQGHSKQEQEPTLAFPSQLSCRRRFHLLALMRALTSVLARELLSEHLRKRVVVVN